MFGLMKNTDCIQVNQKDWYRKHYCGTCKSIGSLYGQRSRTLLNFDCVFLAELLSVIQEVDTEQWDPKLGKRNCFVSPDPDILPLSLQYAADINLILAEMKVRDNLQDGVPFFWKMAQRVFRKPFGKLQDRMVQWGIDRQLLINYQQEDAARECKFPHTDSISELLEWHAAPTAAITSYLFAKGANSVQKPGWQVDLAAIGAAFGELVYGLDAWKDVEKDEDSGNFNLLLLLPKDKLEVSKQTAKDWLWEKAGSIQDLIQQANFSGEVKASLNSRLMLNLSAALKESPQVYPAPSGIEKASVPTMARRINRVQRGLRAWTNPLRPARFAATYIVLLLVMFHQQLFAVADFGRQESFSPNYWLLGLLLGTPIALYFLAKTLSRNRAWLVLQLKQQQRKVRRMSRRAERKPEEKKAKRKKVEDTFGYILGILLIVLVSVLLVLAIPEDSFCGLCLENPEACEFCCEVSGCCCEVIGAC